MILKRLTAVVLFLLLASPAFATIYYVAATGGSDGRSCMTAQTSGTPKASIASGITCLTTAGDTLLVRTGTYAEAFGDTITPGTAFTAGSAITIQAFGCNPDTTVYGPGSSCEVVTIRPASGAEIFNFGGSRGNTVKYIIVLGFILDAVNINNFGFTVQPGGQITKIDCTATCANHIRFQNNIIKNGPGNGVLVFGASNEFLNNEFTNNATSSAPCGVGCTTQEPGHDLYMAAASNIIDGNWIHDSGFAGPSTSTSGIQTYGTCCANSNNLIRNNLFGNHPFGNQIIIAHGDNNQVYNNKLYGTGCGIHVAFSSSNSLVANNSITGQNCTDPVIAVNNTGGGTSIWNNAIFGNTNNTAPANDSDWVSLGGAAESGVNTRAKNNLFTDPSWVNTASPNFNFHLNSGSAAVNAGCVSGGTPNCSTITSFFTTDADGVARGAVPWDVGAHELVSTVKTYYYASLNIRNR